VRELHNALRNLMLGLPAQAAPSAQRTPAADVEGIPPRVLGCAATLQEVEDWYTQRVLKRTGGKLAETSRILGVDRSTLRRRSRRDAAEG
jgi:DNA-binding NtrC family response regulator